ncbi:MAG: Tyrosine recombinase XerC [Eubacteriales bacterium SKADARSKE-1]|nr:Tyrosine recombinase XerC [Eubacteriales bacterium SKADARSKE-1]
MTGTLQIKRDKYYCVLDFKNEEGERKLKWVSTGLDVKGNKRKATEFLNDLLVQQSVKIQQGTNDNDIFFSDYLMHWLEKKKNKVELTTYDGYRMQIEKHILPYFEKRKLKLSEIKPFHIGEFYEFEFESGKRIGEGGLSTRTIKLQRFVIKACLDEAVFYEFINRNPATNIPLPKKDTKVQKVTFLDAESANKVLRLFKGHPLQPLIYVTLYYGLRRSEVLGLKWSAIDFKNNTIEISHTVVQNLSIVAKDKTKTNSSQRKYVLLPEIKEILLDLFKRSKENKKLFGNTYISTDYVFTWQDGRPYRPDYITQEFQKVLAKNSFPKMRFHDLRHSCASVLHDKGWELKDIQTWLGHANIATTADIYTHISNSRKNEMAKDIQNTFSL